MSRCQIIVRSDHLLTLSHYSHIFKTSIPLDGGAAEIGVEK